MGAPPQFNFDVSKDPQYAELGLPDLPPDSILAVDTETSGLHVDDGARLSVVSLAWWGEHPLAPQSDTSAPPRPIHSLVLPFDHGFETPLGRKDVDPSLYPKSKRKNLVPGLFDDEFTAPNLSPDSYPVLIEWLSLHSLVFQNAPFDLHMLATGLRTREFDHLRFLPAAFDLSHNVYWDTQVVNPVIWPEFPTSLKPTAQRLWGIQEGDSQRALQKYLKGNGYRFDLAPWDMLEPYAAQDAELTLRLCDHHLQLIESGECIPATSNQAEFMQVCEREVDLSITLYRMERRGVGYDVSLSLNEADRLHELADLSELQFRKAQKSAFPHAYPTLNMVPPISDTSVKAFWFNKPTDSPPGLGLFPPQVTDKGAPSIAKEAVAELIRAKTPGAVHFELFSKCETAASMWYSGWAKMAGPPDPQHHPPTPEIELPKLSHPAFGTRATLYTPHDARWPRLRTHYRQSATNADKGRAKEYGEGGGTISGRIAVERIQLQAVPHDYQLPTLDPPLQSVRKLFRADPGYELWELDLRQAEFRAMAGVANCRKMIDAIEDPVKPWDAHDSTTELMFKITRDHPDWKFKRNVGKRLNFGSAYTAGAATIARQIEMYTGVRPDEDEMRAWLDDFKRTFPEIPRASRRAINQVERFHRIQLAGGRERWFSPYEPTHKAFNALIQGGVAEMMKVAMIDVEAQHPGVLLLQIHDSLVVELPADEASSLVSSIKTILCKPFTEAFGVRFEADASRWGA